MKKKNEASKRLLAGTLGVLAGAVPVAYVISQVSPFDALAVEADVELFATTKKWRNIQSAAPVGDSGISIQAFNAFNPYYLTDEERAFALKSIKTNNTSNYVFKKPDGGDVGEAEFAQYFEVEKSGAIKALQAVHQDTTAAIEKFNAAKHAVQSQSSSEASKGQAQSYLNYLQMTEGDLVPQMLGFDGSTYPIPLEPNSDEPFAFKITEIPAQYNGDISQYVAAIKSNFLDGFANTSPELINDIVSSNYLQKLTEATMYHHAKKTYGVELPFTWGTDDDGHLKKLDNPTVWLDFSQFATQFGGNIRYYNSEGQAPEPGTNGYGMGYSVMPDFFAVPSETLDAMIPNVLSPKPGTQTNAQEFPPKDGTYSVNIDQVGTSTTKDAVKAAVTFDGDGANQVKERQIVDEAQFPSTVGTHPVKVKIIYKDDSEAEATVQLTVTQTKAQTYEPSEKQPYTVDFGANTPTLDDLKSSIQFTPDNGNVGNYTLTIAPDSPNQLPDPKQANKSDTDTPVKLQVQYDDGSTDTVTINVKVNKSLADQDKESHPNGTPVSYKSDATNKDDVIKGGATSQFTEGAGGKITSKTLGQTAPTDVTPDGGPATNVPVTINYTDGSSRTVEVPVTVLPTDAQKYTPTVAPLNVPYKGTMDDATLKSAITIAGGPNFTVALKGGETMPNTQNGGTTQQVTVTITYDDGTSEEAQITVNVDKSLAQKDTGLQDGETTYPSNEQPATREQKIKDAITTTTADAGIRDKQIQGAVPENYNGGTPENVTVKVIYTDGSENTRNVRVTVTQTDAEKYPATAAHPLPVQFGSTLTKDDLKRAITVQPNLPTGQNWDIELLPTSELPNPKDEANSGQTKAVPVKVTYPDGSSKEVTVNVEISKSLAQQDTEANPQPTAVTYKTNTPQDQMIAKIKAGATSTKADETEVTGREIVDGDASIPTTYTGNAVPVKVKLLYADGSSRIVSVPVTVEQTDADKYDPQVSAGALSVNKDDTQTTQTRDAILAKVTLPAGATNATKEIEGTVPSAVGEHKVKVKVTYPDQTTDTVEVDLTVTQTDTQKYTAASTETLEVPYKGNLVLDDLKKVITFAPELDPADSYTIQLMPDNELPSTTDGDTTKTVGVKVVYDDNTEDIINVTIHVGKSLAQTYEPEEKAPYTVDFGANAINPDDLKNAIGFAPNDNGEGAYTVAVDPTTPLPDPKATDKSGTTTPVKVTVTYADGSTDTVTINVKVNKSLADQDKESHPTGTAVSYKSNAQDKDDIIKGGAKSSIPEEKITGKTVDEAAPTVVTPEDGTPTNVPVTISYSDGSSRTVQVPVTVLPTDAQKYKAVSTEPLQVPFKGALTVEDLKAKITIPGFPEGAEYQIALADPAQSPLPDTNLLKNAGTEHTVPVKITYPDGTEGFTEVNVQIGDTLAEMDNKKNVQADPVTYPETEKPATMQQLIEAAAKTDNDAKTVTGRAIVGGEASIPKTYNDGKPVMVQVKLTFSDDSTRTLDVPVTVTNDAKAFEKEFEKVITDSNPVSYPAGNTQETNQKEIEAGIISKLSNGATKPIDNYKFLSPIPVDATGDKPVEVKVEISFADGTKQTVNVPVTVKPVYIGSGLHHNTDSTPSTPAPQPEKPAEPSKPTGNDGKPVDIDQKMEDNDRGNISYTGEKTADGKKIYEKKPYIFGYPDGTVRPVRALTRAEIATMIARLEGLNMTDHSRPNFKDVKSSWYNSAINAVVKHGFMRGYPDGTFRADAAITRAELVTIIDALQKTNTAAAPFTDVRGHWAEASIAKSFGNGIIDGYPNREFKPNQTITRSETAKILNQIYDYVLNAENLEKVESMKTFKKFPDNKKSEWSYKSMVEATNQYFYFRLAVPGETGAGRKEVIVSLPKK